MATQTTTILGAGLGGVVVAVAGAFAGLGINALTYGLSGLLLFQIAAEAGRIPRRADAAARSFWFDFAEGVRDMRDHPPVLAITVGLLPFNFLALTALTYIVVYAAFLYGSGAAVFGYLIAGLSVGTALGALAVGRIRAGPFAGLLVGLSTVVGGAGFGLMAVGRTFPVSLAGAALIGLSIGLTNTAYFATMQTIVPNELLARVLSIDSVGSFVSIPAGVVVGGVLAARYGILFDYSVAALGIVLLGVVLVALPVVRAFRTEGRAALPGGESPPP